MRCDVPLKSSSIVSSASVGGSLCLPGSSFHLFAFTASAPTPQLFPNDLKPIHTPEEDHGDETRPD
jgi:hypothetical protein